MTFLGIDLGTSGIRVLLIDENGTPIGTTERRYESSHPRSGWSEQNPADWIEALEGAIAVLRTSYPAFVNLRGIGVSGQMHGATLLDASGHVLRPCILWNDTRSHIQAAQLDRLDQVRQLSGNMVFPGFTAPKLEWVRQNEPIIYAKIAKVLLPAAYLNYYLTGEFVADMSDCSGTSWLDVGTRDWSEILLAAGHMSRDQMPSLVEGSEEAGTLRVSLMRKWGLSGSISVAGGAADNAAAACGIGTHDEGQGFVSLGTSGVLLAARNEYRPAPETGLHTFCHAIPNRWYQMGVMLSATDNLNWLSRITNSQPEDLTKTLGDTLQRPSMVRFLPYLSGERTPHNDAEIRASFMGLGAETSRDDLTRSVLEGVAFGLRDSFEALRTTNTPISSLMVIGGGAASGYWVQLIATVLNIPLLIPCDGELGAALGAARLALCAATHADPESVMGQPDIADIIDPVARMRGAFDSAYQDFKRAYLAIKSIQ